MANSYSSVTKIFAINVSTNVAGLVALKGSAPGAADTVTGTGSPTLTVESDLRLGALGGCVLSVGVGVDLVVVPAPTVVVTEDLLARTRDLIAELVEDEYDDADDILPAINEGKRRMFGQLDVLPTAFTLSLSTGVATYTLSELVARWGWMRYGTSTDLRPLHLEEFASLLSQSGQPSHYCPDFLSSLGAQQIKFWPTPAATEASIVTGFFYAEPPDLVAGATPAWHALYHTVPCYWAAAVLLHRDRLHDVADQMESRFSGLVGEYAAWYERKFPARLDTTQGVRQSPSAPWAYPYEITAP